MTGTTGRTPPVRNAQCAISIGASVQFHIGTDIETLSGPYVIHGDRRLLT
jgi:hypothetical protein